MPADAEEMAEADPGGGKASEARENQRALAIEPRWYSEAELRAQDSRLQSLTHANRRVLEAYGNTIHLNDGTHLDGGVADGAFWQRLHYRV